MIHRMEYFWVIPIFTIFDSDIPIFALLSSDIPIFGNIFSDIPIFDPPIAPPHLADIWGPVAQHYGHLGPNLAQNQVFG